MGTEPYGGVLFRVCVTSSFFHGKHGLMAQVVLPCPLLSIPTTEQERGSNSSLSRCLKRLQTCLKVMSRENNLSACSQ